MRPIRKDKKGYYSVEDFLPEKGINIVGIDGNNEKRYCFRCECKNEDCKEWRCSITGYGLIVDIIKWKYDDES